MPRGRPPAERLSSRSETLRFSELELLDERRDDPTELELVPDDVEQRGAAQPSELFLEDTVPVGQKSPGREWMRVAEFLPGTEIGLADHLPRDALRPECMDKANLLEVKEAERSDPVDYWVITVDDRRGLPDVASN